MDRSKLHLPPARHYRKTFETARTVKRATVHASALGLCELHLNGRRVGDGWLEPGWSDYAKRGYYRSHDVTAWMKPGVNTLGAIVSEGWYAGLCGLRAAGGLRAEQDGRNFYGKTPALRAQLEIEYADGSRETVGSPMDVGR
jgi:alpha-L-rhamnosidase